MPWQVVCGGLLVASGATAHPEEGPPRRVLSVNPLGPVVGFHSLEYEQAVHPRWSLYVQPGFTPGGGSTDVLVSIRPGPFLSGGARLFLTGEAPTGLFVASGAHVYVSSPFRDVRTGVDVVVGGAWLAGPVYLSAGLGGMYSAMPVGGASPSLLPTARANVGVAF
jgi:hypothetical protein